MRSFLDSLLLFLTTYTAVEFKFQLHDFVQSRIWSVMTQHLRVDGAGDAVVELGIELGKLVAGKKRIFSQEIGKKLDQPISNTASEI